MPRRDSWDDDAAAFGRANRPRRPAARDREEPAVADAAPPPAATPIAPPFRGTVVGIDPGFSGGLAALDLVTGQATAIAMPARAVKGGNEIDVPAVVAWLDAAAAIGPVRLVAIERVQAMPRDSRSGAFKFGYYYGKLVATCEVRGLPLELVQPQAWQKAVLAGTRGKTKADAIAYVRRRYPGVSLRATPRSTKDHDGIADAVCLAEWARRQIVGG